MKVGGYNTQTDYSKLGTALLIGACVILAVRTARWPLRRSQNTASDRDLEAEVDHAIVVAGRLLSTLVFRQQGMFPTKQVPWYLASDDDVAK